MPFSSCKLNSPRKLILVLRNDLNELSNILKITFLSRWYVDFGMERFGTSDITSLLVSYYLAAASVFEPERSKERIAWAKTTTLVDTISSFFHSLKISNEHRREFVEEFRNISNSIHHAK